MGLQNSQSEGEPPFSSRPLFHRYQTHESRPRIAGAGFHRCRELWGATDLFIIPQSLTRIPFPQFEPHGSETTRPWGFVVHWRRDGLSCPQDSQRIAILWRLPESLILRRARHRRFTRSALRRPNSGPNSRLSLCLAASGLSSGCDPSIGRNLPGLASVASTKPHRNPLQAVIAGNRGASNSQAFSPVDLKHQTSRTCR